MPKQPFCFIQEAPLFARAHSQTSKVSCCLYLSEYSPQDSLEAFSDALPYVQAFVNTMNNVEK